MKAWFCYIDIFEAFGPRAITRLFDPGCGVPQASPGILRVVHQVPKTVGLPVSLEYYTG